MKNTDNPNRQTVYREIQQLLGVVPKFFQDIPDETLAQEWHVFKTIELSESKLPLKTKELIGIGISAATKCQYCIEFHTTAAKLFGATDEEIAETLWYAKNSSGWSTYLNGSQYDHGEFRRELQEVVKHVGAKMAEKKSA
jgi:AhpD family alkylhydroperoxidase